MTIDLVIDRIPDASTIRVSRYLQYMYKCGEQTFETVTGPPAK